MILQIDDWKFDIDLTRTIEYSVKETVEHCDCAYCRNFYETVDSHLPQLRPFLAQFGLNVEAPDEMLPVICDMLLYDPTYKVYGKILQFGCNKMRAGLCNIIARAEDEKADYFWLDCFEVLLPWNLDEPLRDVISTANEPSRLERMWQKFLGKAFDKDIMS